ncbi:MAG: phosphatase PAP2 family protein [Sphingobacteriaceae bacterium]|nr:phosphatase PAP2 family protein [Sphingobacteriaceae bacterium]
MQNIILGLLSMDFISKIKHSNWFFYGTSLILCIGFIFLCLFGKSESFFLLNSFHTPSLDYFFILFTNLGDGKFALALCILALVLYKKKIYALSLLYAFIVSGIVAQILKRLVDTPRPKLYFNHGEFTQFIDGIEIATQHSFPSGHTATAFAMATAIIMLMKSRKWQIQILAVATLVGFSRIYLGQHFLLDVLVGALIGCISGMAAIPLAERTLKGIEKWKNHTRTSHEKSTPASL